MGVLLTPHLSLNNNKTHSINELVGFECARSAHVTYIQQVVSLWKQTLRLKWVPNNIWSE